MPYLGGNKSTSDECDGDCGDCPIEEGVLC